MQNAATMLKEPLKIKQQVLLKLFSFCVLNLNQVRDMTHLMLSILYIFHYFKLGMFVFVKEHFKIEFKLF